MELWPRPQAARTLNSSVWRTVVPGLPANTGTALCGAVLVFLLGSPGVGARSEEEDVLVRCWSETGSEGAGPQTPGKAPGPAPGT